MTFDTYRSDDEDLAHLDILRAINKLPYGAALLGLSWETATNEDVAKWLSSFGTVLERHAEEVRNTERALAEAEADKRYLQKRLTSAEQHIDRLSALMTGVER